MKSLKWFLYKKQLIKDQTAKNLSAAYSEKARTNIVTMELLSKAPKHKDVLELPEDYDSSEWVIIAAYYAMYLAALSILVKIEFRSKNHSATIKALEEFFVKKKLLDKKYLESLEKVKLNKEELGELTKAKDRREIAQYSVTKKTSEDLAEESKKEAHKFVDKMEELNDLLE